MKTLSKFQLNAVLVAVLLPCFAGCLSRPSLTRQGYALHAEPAHSASAHAGGVLSVRSCEVSPMFAGRALIYRVGPNAYESDSYAGFVVPPNRAVAIPVRTYFRNSGAFNDVVEPGSDLRADTLLEVYVTELYGDFRNRTQPVAVLSLHMIFFDASARTVGRPFLQKTYSKRLTIPQNSAPALVAGWNQALSEILAEAVSDVTTARQQTADSGDP